MIAYFGKDLIFEVSDKRIHTINEMSREASSRFASHEVIARKPKTEYIGPGLDTISFTVFVSVSLGVNPREQMDLWVSKCRNGYVDYFVIGGKPLGLDKWVIKSVSESWDTIVKDGLLYSGKIQVSLEEYIS